MRTLRLAPEHLTRFAEASGDWNPLHVDERFAHGTPYGRCIAHGGLVTIAALGSANDHALRHTQALDVQFKQPVFPEDECRVDIAEETDEKVRIEVTHGGRLALSVAITVEPAVALQDAPLEEPNFASDAPRVHTVEELMAGETTITEPYGADVATLSALARDLGADQVPAALLQWLAAASFTVGMLLPGRDALFAGGRIVRSPARNAGELVASVQAADERTGFVSVVASLAAGEASADLTLHTFLRPSVPEPDRERIARFLAPSTELDGHKILVVGGSRGLGAALSGGLATQGANVWVGYSRSREQAERLRDEFGAERIRLLQFDAADAAQAADAFAGLRAETGELDGVVLSAAPPLGDAALRPGGSRAAVNFVASSVATMLIPLAEALELLSADGWVIIMSSSALDDPPESWPHYVVAKAALEGAAAYCARQSPVRVIVVRAPKTWTDGTNTPMGRIGAAEKEQIAAVIIRHVLEAEATGSLELLTAEQLAEVGA
jgi:NAD(P)-dependent dehydrogenase (short-subunit alcohol dehydrogenase family)